MEDPDWTDPDLDRQLVRHFKTLQFSSCAQSALVSSGENYLLCSVRETRLKHETGISV
jgi:hypothetical protein